MPRDKVDVAKRSVDLYNRRDIDAFFAECATADIEWWPALMRAYGGDCYRVPQRTVFSLQIVARP